MAGNTDGCHSINTIKLSAIPDKIFYIEFYGLNRRNIFLLFQSKSRAVRQYM